MSQNPQHGNHPPQDPSQNQAPQYVPQATGMATQPGPYENSYAPTAPGYNGYSGNDSNRNRNKRQKNVMGIIAFGLAVLGFIFGCVPGALIVGWILLPIAFLLAIISFFLKGGKAFSISALIISVIGTIVSVLVFFFVAATAFDEAFNDEVSGVPPAAEQGDVEQAEGAAVNDDAPAGDEGTRANPYPLETVMSSDSWDITITDVSLDATDDVLAENPYNEAPADGNQYMLVDVEITYTGDNPDGEIPMMMIDYVSSDGNTYSSFESMVVPPNELDLYSPLYNGGTSTGEVVIEIPSADADKGVLAVTPDMLADKVYIAVK